MKNDHRSHRSKFTAMIILHFHLQPQFKNELFHILLISLKSLSNCSSLSLEDNLFFCRAATISLSDLIPGDCSKYRSSVASSHSNFQFCWCVMLAYSLLVCWWDVFQVYSHVSLVLSPLMPAVSVTVSCVFTLIMSHRQTLQEQSHSVVYEVDYGGSSQEP